MDKKVPISLLAGIVLQTVALVMYAAADTACKDSIDERQDDSIKELKQANAENTASVSSMNADVAVVKAAVIDIKRDIKNWASSSALNSTVPTRRGRLLTLKRATANSTQ